MNFNSVDIAILAVFFLSILAGLMRGMIREVISLFTWIAAFVVSIYFSGPLASAFTNPVRAAASSLTPAAGVNPAHSISFLGIGASFIGLFVVTLIIG